MNRYNRHTILSEIGEKGQHLISQAKVMVVGAGGLGCPVLQYLAAAGIGTLGIMDFDVVEESNLQRQVLFGTSSLGKHKAIAARKRLQDLNPTIHIKVCTKKLSKHNSINILSEYDVIVDGTDNFATRYLINDTAVLLNKPVVYGAIFKFEGQVAVFNYQNGPSYRCLFPEPPALETVLSCSEIGVLGVLPGIIGTMQANEVLKLILGIGDVLSGKLYCYNALTGQSTTIKLQRNRFAIENVQQQGLQSNYEEEVICENKHMELSVKAALKIENIQFIDVREFHEEPKIEYPDLLQLPLSTLKKYISTVNHERVKVFFCKSGIRGKKAMEIANKFNIPNCYSLQEGAVVLQKSIHD